LGLSVAYAPDPTFAVEFGGGWSLTGGFDLTAALQLRHPIALERLHTLTPYLGLALSYTPSFQKFRAFPGLVETSVGDTVPSHFGGLRRSCFGLWDCGVQNTGFDKPASLLLRPVGFDKPVGLLLRPPRPLLFFVCCYADAST
jgi:hypothetical protein